MDGTLYDFDQQPGQTFAKSQFYADMRANSYLFLADALGVSLAEGEKLFLELKSKYDGEISLGVEQEFGIGRDEYFNNTWNMDPTGYISKDEGLPEALGDLRGDVALLTAAPRIWTNNVLSYLNLTTIFEGRIYTGEPDLRKPNPLVFQGIADDFNIPPTRMVSVGDQEYSDIAPARSIGMKTIFIGSTPTTADYQVNNVKAAIALLREGLR